MRILTLVYVLLLAAIAPGAYRLAMSQPLAEYTPIFIGAVVALAAVFVMRREIGLWLYRRTSPVVDPKLEAILARMLLGYPQAQFDTGYTYKEMMIYHHLCEFINQGIPDPPDDVAHAITMHAFYFKALDDRWPQHYQRIALYGHPFLSPAYPDDVHIVEAYRQDGTLLLSMAQLMPGLQSSQQYFNTALLAYAMAYVELYDTSIGRIDQAWSVIEQISPRTPTELTDYIGIEVDARALLLYYAVKHPNRLVQVAPMVAEQLKAFLPGRLKKVKSAGSSAP